MKGLYAQPKYPSMERQDLTQGQLGSFKFTPIDVPSSTLGDTPFFLQAQARLRARVGDPGSITAGNQSSFPVASQQWLAAPKSRFSFPAALSTDSTTSDPAFFNTHLKPDLEDSRLKFGPAAFRAAVAGNSPDRDFSQSRPRAESNLTNLHYSPINNQPVWTMNPTASSFDPSGWSSDSDDNQVFVSYKSLVRCLEAEQDRHEQTKRQLEQARTHIDDLEAELKKTQAEKNSLTGSVKMLSGIIKHNKDRLEKKVGAASENLTGTSAKDTAAAFPTTPSMAIPQSATNGHSPSITNIAKPKSSETTLVKQVDFSIDQNELFNLELLKTQPQDDPNSLASRRSRTLRKHFMLDDDSEASTDKIAAAAELSGDTDELVQVSPPQADKLRSSLNMASTTPTTVVFKEESQQAAPANTNTETAVDTPRKYSSVKLQTADQPILELPAEFLAKYQKKKKQSNQASANQSMADADAFNESDTSGKPPASSFATMHSLNARNTCTSNPVDTAGPYELSIKWAINKENPALEEEDIPELLRSQPYGTSFDVFWKHPVRYLDHDSKNIFRTVMIDYIPADATCQDVLDEICSGSLEKIELVPSIANTAKYQTARVVFNFELGASTTANFARDHGMRIKGQTVRVWQVLTQTYPKNSQLDQDVFDRGFTRLLIINNASQEALATLSTKLKWFKTSIVCFSKTYDGYPLIEFASVASAARAMRLLMRDPNFREAEFDFDEDPCGRFGQDGAAMNGF